MILSRIAQSSKLTRGIQALQPISLKTQWHRTFNSTSLALPRKASLLLSQNPAFSKSSRLKQFSCVGIRLFSNSGVISRAEASANYNSSKVANANDGPKPELEKLVHETPAAGSAKKVNVTKSELLSQASSSISRLWVHIRWPLTRNNRPFSLDDFSAFASWLIMGQVLWIVLGTTTFVLAAMYFIDTFDQFWKIIQGEDSPGKNAGKSQASPDESFLGRIAGQVLSHGSGVRILFEKGSVLPQLEDGMLKFKNIRILSTHSSSKSVSLDFSASIPMLNLSLSFKKWYEGRGLICNLEIIGMHAKVSRTCMNPKHDNPTIKNPLSAFSSLALSFSGFHESEEHKDDINEHKVKELTKTTEDIGSSFLDSDYELANVRVRDSVIEITDGLDIKPFKISIFNCDLPRLRGDRLLIDFFNASIVTGTLNNSMFTIHKQQTFLENGNTVTFKLDGIDMRSLSIANPKSKFNWLVGGKAEILAEIRLPNLEESNTANKSSSTSGAFSRLLGELSDLTDPKPSSDANTSGDGNLLKDALMAIYETFANGAEQRVRTHDTDYVIVNAKIKFTDLKASLPSHLPMASSAPVAFTSLHSLRSLISYVNSLETGEPLIFKTTVIERFADLYNVDNVTQTKIYDAIIGDIYEEFSRMIKADEMRLIREKSSMWSHSVMSQLLLLGLGVFA